MQKGNSKRLFGWIPSSFPPWWTSPIFIDSCNGTTKASGGWQSPSNLNAAGPIYDLGLLKIRQKRYQEALGLLAKAAALQPDNSRYSYVYALALQSALSLINYRALCLLLTREKA